MLNILINAYACSPNWGSEPGMAWNWITNIARYCKCFVITEGEWRNEIEEALKTHPLRDNITFYYNPVPQKVRDMCWNQGDWRFYYYYRKWQKSTLKIAEQICNENKIDITHQLNMIGFREPGLLWKIKGVKHVWGPIGSMGEVPVEFLKDLPLTVRLKQSLKNLITRYQIKHSPVKDAIKNCDALIAALDITRDQIKKNYGVEVPVIGETGLKPNCGYTHKDCIGRPIELLWVGRFIPTKKLSIALEALAKVKNPNDFRLHIVGTGTDEEVKQYKSLAQELGVNEICTWYGKIPNEQVQQMMREKDLFFFSSVFEGGPHVILESITNNIPILCFDTCGQGVVVDDSIGIKVPLTNQEEGVVAFAEKLNYINNNRKLLADMSANCTNKQQELSWDSKVKKMIEIYNKLVKD